MPLRRPGNTSRWNGATAYQWGAAEEPARAQPRCLGESGAGVGRFDGPLEPCFARESHFGVEDEPSVGCEVLDPPKVDGFTDREVLGVAAAASKAGSARYAVEPAAEFPQQFTSVPAPPAANTAYRSPCVVCVGGDDGAANFGELGATRPCRIGRCGMPDRLGGCHGFC